MIYLKSEWNKMSSIEIKFNNGHDHSRPHDTFEIVENSNHKWISNLDTTSIAGYKALILQTNFVQLKWHDFRLRFFIWIELNYVQIYLIFISLIFITEYKYQSNDYIFKPKISKNQPTFLRFLLFKKYLSFDNINNGPVTKI